MLLHSNLTGLPVSALDTKWGLPNPSSTARCGLTVVSTQDCHPTPLPLSTDPLIPQSKTSLLSPMTPLGLGLGTHPSRPE